MSRHNRKAEPEEEEKFVEITFEEADAISLRKWWMDFNDKGETWYMAVTYRRLQAQKSEEFIDRFMELPRHCDTAKQRFREMKELLEIVEI